MSERANAEIASDLLAWASEEEARIESPHEGFTGGEMSELYIKAAKLREAAAALLRAPAAIRGYWFDTESWICECGYMTGRDRPSCSKCWQPTRPPMLRLRAPAAGVDVGRKRGSSRLHGRPLDEDGAVEFRPAESQLAAPAAGVSVDRPTIVCLCGSTRFPDAWREAYRAESFAGRIVLSVGVLIQDGAEPIRTDGPDKTALDELHKRKIDLADEVLVVSDATGYFGSSTTSEIAYARGLGRPVRFAVAASEERARTIAPAAIRALPEAQPTPLDCGQAPDACGRPLNDDTVRSFLETIYVGGTVGDVAKPEPEPPQPYGYGIVKPDGSAAWEEDICVADEPEILRDYCHMMDTALRVVRLFWAEMPQEEPKP